MHRSLATAAIIASTLLLTTACGGEEATEPPAASATASPSESESATASPSESSSPSVSEPSASAPAASQVIEITFADGTVTPNGKRVDVAVGEPLELEVTAPEAGELHVHSTPEQELAYDAGTTTLTLTIDTPGVVDVESHDLGQIIVQLEAR